METRRRAAYPVGMRSARAPEWAGTRPGGAGGARRPRALRRVGVPLRRPLRRVVAVAAVVAVAGSATALGGAQRGVAAPACPVLGGCVTVDATGPRPATLDIYPGTAVWFVGETPATVVFSTTACSEPVSTATPNPDRALGVCRFFDAGSYPYRIERPGWVAFGQVVVRDPRWITIEPPVTRVVYGDCATVRGTAYRYPHYGGPPPVPTPVSVFGRTAVGPADGTTVAAEGASLGNPGEDTWAATLCPRAVTWYHARALGHEADEIRVDVAPRLTVRRTRRVLTAAVVPARPFGGRPAVLQRRTASGSWAGLRTLFFDGAGRISFVPQLRRGSVVRVFAPALAGRFGPAFVDGVSLPVRVR